MKMNSSKLFFLSFMMIGIMFCLCSNNWLFIWCGLELSLITFLPLIQSKMIMSSESSVKYFLVQSISSSILILGLMMMLMSKLNYNFFIALSAMIKMGVAPFHSWLPSLIDGLYILPLILMFTFLKIPPLIVVTFTDLSLSLFISLTMMVGSLFGLNQSSSRKIITYSSIFNIGLILMCIGNNFIWMFYLLIYSSLVVTFMMLIQHMNMNYLNQIIYSEQYIFNKLILLFNLLSMGGMPPLIGFSIKLIVIEFCIQIGIIFNLFMMILFSLMVMFFYIRVCYFSMMFYCINFKWNLTSINYFNLFLLLINFLSLPLVLILTGFY
uniref:NADH dehydrogenase subunit 2 n=1 Tax=Cassianeura bimaculata TaxID=2932621 RepID=UPI001FF57CE4|nr:NADH dehydrogenase subunit 2 [Cassianeura bimaculata]UOH96527.1 NADH dehydrogenase subunit 2 [Cassianeura bimaculata]